EESLFSFPIPANAFADVDAGETLTFSNLLPLPAWLTFNGTSYSGTPADTDVGSVTVSVRATDPHGASADQTFIINVNNTNDPPVAASDSNDVTEDAVLSVSGNLLTNDNDGDANVVQGLTVPVLQGGTDGGATLTRIGAHGTLVITKATGAYTY